MAAPPPAAVPGRPSASQEARQPARPGFDIVRVEPTGDAVVAGRASPNTEVALLDRGTVIARTKTDASGQFAIIPPRLPAGDHLLALGEKSGSGQVISTQTVAVAVPKKKGSGGVVVALTEPDQPTRVLSDTADKAPPGAKPQPAPVVAIDTVEAQEDGGFFATGSATPGAEVRLYLNGSALADLHAAKSGRWSLHITKGMTPGSYSVRADQIDAASGKVAARAEVPFDYEALATAAADSGHAAAKAKAPTSRGGAAEPAGAAPQSHAARESTVAKPAAATKAAVATADGGAAKERAPTVPSAPSQTGARSAPTMEASASDALIAVINTVTVVRGDSLWRISRRILGRGIRYTQIYAANSSQIRDPNLIYPGQILVEPKTSVN